MDIETPNRKRRLDDSNSPNAIATPPPKRANPTVETLETKLNKATDNTLPSPINNDSNHTDTERAFVETINSTIHNLNNPPTTIPPSPIYFTISLEEKRPPNPQESNIITKAFKEHLGPHVLQTYDRTNKLGPRFIIPRHMLSRAHGFNYIPNHPNLHIVGMESALKPIGGHGRNLKFYPSPNRQSQDINVDKQPTTSTGIIYDIPLGADLQSFQKTFNQNGQLIKTLYRVTNKNKGPTECVKIIFNTSTAPTLLRADKDYTVHPCRIPYLRCNQCQEHGHSTNTCPNKHTKCPHCSGPHTHDQCTSNYYKCANCSGNHGAAYKKCTAYLEHKEQIDKLSQTNEFTWTERGQDPTYHRHARKIQSLMNIKEFPLLKKNKPKHRYPRQSNTTTNHKQLT